MIVRIMMIGGYVYGGGGGGDGRKGWAEPVAIAPVDLNGKKI